MKTWTKAILGISLSFMCLFTCIGYAAVSDTISVFGKAKAEPPDYDEVVITEVIPCSTTTATQTTSRVPPTNIKSEITGDAGNKIVYQITAHNYSETETYVYTGPRYSDEYASVANKLTFSASNDEQNTQKIPASSDANFYEGTPVAPGEEIVFYVTYTLNSNLSASEIMVNFKFEPVIYTVTYLVNDEVYAVDCITNNSIEYSVTREYVSTDASLEFDYWMNAGSTHVTSIPAYNTDNVNLYPSYVGVYTATFVDHSANIVAWGHFTRNNYSNITAMGNDTSIRPVVEDCV